MHKNKLQLPSLVGLSSFQQVANEDARRNGVNALARIIRERCEKENGEKKKWSPHFGGDISEVATRLAQSIERALWAHCGGVAKNYRVK